MLLNLLVELLNGCVDLVLPLLLLLSLFILFVEHLVSRDLPTHLGILSLNVSHLAIDYHALVFKHCFGVSLIEQVCLHANVILKFLTR